MSVQRTANARWNGDLKSGSGRIRLESGAMSESYTAASRFESGGGTNPEELIAAAEAACFAMALTKQLSEEGYDPGEVSADASVTLDDGAITRVHLTCGGTVPGIDAETFRDLANKARVGCTVSRALKGPEITVEASLR